MNKYFLPEDYRENTANMTREVDGIAYWTPETIKLARIYQIDVYKWAKKIISKNGLNSALDVGCGPAIKFNRMIVPNVKRAVGIDQQSVIEYCKKKYDSGEYIIDNFEDPTGQLKDKFELIICCDVIEHMNDPVALLDYLRGFATNESLVLISTPDRERLHGPKCKHSPNPAHIREWRADEFDRFIANHGFSVIERRFLAPVGWLPLNQLSIRHCARQLIDGHRWRYNYAALCKAEPMHSVVDLELSGTQSNNGTAGND